MSDKHTTAAEAYAKSSIETAPPLKVVRLLYQGAIRFLDQASASDPRAVGSKFAHHLGRAQDVIVELRLALDPAHAPEIAQSLSDLYLFVENAIQRARREQSAEPLAGARTVLVTLLEAWSGIEGKQVP